MFRQLSRSLATRLGITIILIELGFMLTVGLLYYNNFSQQIDERQEDRLEAASQIIIDGGLNLATLVDQAIMTLLLGDDVADAMLLSPEGQVLFSLDPAYRRVAIAEVPFLEDSSLDFSSNSLSFNRLTLNNEPFLSSARVFTSSGNQTFLLYFRVSTLGAEQEKANILILLIVGFTAIVVATSAVIFFFFNSVLFRRINDLVKVMGRVEAGDLSARAASPNGTTPELFDELDILQQGSNTMISRLQDLVQTLEDRVQARTHDLLVSSEVSRFVTTVLNQKRLLSQLVELTRDSFHFYHVAIFLYHTDRQSLSLEAASGELGKKRLEIGQNFKLQDNGLVPTAGREQRPLVSNNVATSPAHVDNTFLPETRSELALPIIFAGELIGVLDLQAEEENRFSESDTRLFSSFANQIAVAIRNAGLFEEVLQARERAEQADKVKSAFLASMSHELRTPLNAIINFSKFLRKGIPGPVNEEQEQLLTGVSESGQHLLNLINDVLDMSKIEAGALKLWVEEDIDIKVIIATAINYTKPSLANKDVIMQEAIPETLPRLRGDRKRLLQILLNILSNACKFTDEGYVTVSAKTEANFIQITIEDTGAGIAPADAEGVFTPFKQTTSGLRQGGGTGLGMPISKKLAEAHDGDLWFESEVDKGTKFFIKLPVQLSQAERLIQNGA